MRKFLCIIVCVITLLSMCSCNFVKTSGEQLSIETNTSSEPTCNDTIPKQHTYWQGVKWKENAINITDFDKETELGIKLTEGNSLPSEPKTGDIFLDYDSYMYVYNMYVNENFTYTVDETMNGWSVRRISTLSQPSFKREIFSEIAGKPVVSARYTFSHISEPDVDVIILPSTINDITGLFYSSNSLKLSVIFNGTVKKFEKCFSETNTIGIIDGKPVIHDSEYKIFISGNCKKELLEKIAKTSEYENIIIK